MTEDGSQITTLLVAWRNGNQQAGKEVIKITYRHLRRIAARYMKHERNNHTLDATALVHELYLRLFSGQPLELKDRAHFFAVASQQLRRLLVDHARRAAAQKRGAGQGNLTVTQIPGWVVNTDVQVLELDKALAELDALDSRAARVVELRFFGGLKETEAAKALGISVATLKRDWEFARAWLKAQMKQ